ncbi:hypothetical protein [Pelosinus sp. UFO1]|uniref:hypothetical protein n=1 Tax=Pelosinus sp. UFO1 TaxID=484770 RepID=UPI00130EFCE6|nr:hypothetical protein [Pelosinus sp. UFO1]
MVSDGTRVLGLISSSPAGAGEAIRTDVARVNVDPKFVKTRATARIAHCKIINLKRGIV